MKLHLTIFQYAKSNSWLGLKLDNANWQRYITLDHEIGLVPVFKKIPCLVSQWGSGPRVRTPPHWSDRARVFVSTSFHIFVLRTLLSNACWHCERCWRPLAWPFQVTVIVLFERHGLLYGTGKITSYNKYSGCPLVWKTWKCQGIWVLFDSCQGNVRDWKSGNCQGKNLVWEKLPKTVHCKLHICVHTGI